MNALHQNFKIIIIMSKCYNNGVWNIITTPFFDIWKFHCNTLKWLHQNKKFPLIALIAKGCDHVGSHSGRAKCTWITVKVRSWCLWPGSLTAQCKMSKERNHTHVYCTDRLEIRKSLFRIQNMHVPYYAFCKVII